MNSTDLSCIGGNRPLRLAILCTFNLDLLRRPLQTRLAEQGVDAQLYFNGYGQCESDAANPDSAFYDFGADAVIVFADVHDLVPLLSPEKMVWNREEAELVGADSWSRLRETLTHLERQLPSDCPVFVHNLATPPSTGIGLLEGNSGYSVSAAIEKVNACLREAAAESSRVHVIDYAALVVNDGWRNWYDRRLWYLGRMRLGRGAIDLLAQYYARYLAASFLPRHKCLVLDLDNTLWGGIVGEDGIHGLDLGSERLGLAFREFQMAILSLAQRGVILAICSKNNRADAMEVIARHPEMVLRPEHFACDEISWDPKPLGIRRIAERLNIGLDSVVFWDDNVREREAVRSQVPEVAVPEVPDDPAQYVDVLLRLSYFDAIALSDEDTRRGELYRQQIRRREHLSTAAGDAAVDFFASLDSEANFAEADDFSLIRLAQLTERTNQLNLTTRRYSETQIRAMHIDPNVALYKGSLRDKFGDLGIIGAAIIRKSAAGWKLDTFLISCRALGRGFEEAFLAFLAAAAGDAGVQLNGEFISTTRNAPARELLDRLGISLNKVSPGHYEFVISPAEATMPSWIRVSEETPAGE